MSPVLKYDQIDNLVTLTMNRPDRLNAFDAELLTALNAAFDKITADKTVRAVVLTGSGRGFNAGADLAELQGALDGGNFGDMSDGLLEHYDPLIKKIVNLPKPVLAAVNGIAAGAGCNMALACDIVIAADTATFLQAFARIGVVADMGGTWHLPRLVGQAKAMGLTMLADQISADKAERIGLIWEVVPEAALASHAFKTGQRLANAPTQALASMKTMIRASFENTFERQLEMEARYQSLASRSHDFKEGVKAFVEKRPAAFKGE